MTLTRIKHFLRNSRQWLFCKKNHVNIEDYKYFIFIDSKVPNIIEQISPYFLKGFFDKDKVLIVFRHHFENVKIVRKALATFSLDSYCFINLRDIPSIKNAIWFYTHNSMTNLAVINKNVYSKHIWMGHGDSEKVSSYKKIIRIYDYCLVSGKKSEERFYKHNIFRKEESYRFIRVGKVVLCSILPTQDRNVNKKVVLFAPTWEGPMKEENYSTLHLSKKNAKFMKIITTTLSIDTIVIKLHPNTGLRDPKVIKYTIETIKSLLSLDKQLILIAKKSDWVYSYVFKEFKEKLEYIDTLYDLHNYKIEAGIVNISAMATMISTEEIETFILYDKLISIQEKVDLGFGIKINLHDLKDNYLITSQNKNKYIQYEKNWETLSQENIFKEMLTFLN